MRARLPCLAVLFVFLVACDDVVERHYRDRGEAVNGDALGGARFLPPFIPNTAHEIVDCHDIDTNRGWFRFKHAAEDRRWPETVGDCWLQSQPPARCPQTELSFDATRYRCCITDHASWRSY